MCSFYILFFLHFLHFKSRSRTCYSRGKYHVVDQSPVPTPPVIMPLDFFLLGCVKDYVHRKLCGWQCNFHARIIKDTWSVVKEMFTCPWADWTGLMWSGLLGVSMLFELRVWLFKLTVCKRWHILMCFGCHVTNFKNTNRTFADTLCKSLKSWIAFHSCIDKISQIYKYAVSPSCMISWNTANCKRDTWKS